MILRDWFRSRPPELEPEIRWRVWMPGGISFYVGATETQIATIIEWGESFVVHAEFDGVVFVGNGKQIIYAERDELPVLWAEHVAKRRAEESA